MLVRDHAHPTQHGNSDEAAHPEVLDETLRAATIALLMKHHRRIQSQVYKRSPGPCDRSHFKSGIFPCCAGYDDSMFREEDCQMSGFMKEIAGPFELRFIYNESSVIDVDTRH